MYPLSGPTPLTVTPRPEDSPLSLRLNQRVTAQVMEIATDHVTLVMEGVQVVARLTSSEQMAMLNERRTARFSTVALVRWPDGREVAAIGEVEGDIVEEARGAEGFGYDPVFRPAEGDGRTFAEMTPAEKHAVSHRGRAFRTLAEGHRVVDALEGQ